jgi:hypothetical protein
VASPGGITAKVGTEPTSGQGTNFGSELRDDQQAAVTQYGAGAVAFVFGRGIDGATLAEITAQLRGLKESYVSRSLISALTLIKIIEYEERSRRYYTPAFAVAARKRAALGSGEPGAGGSDI